EIAKHTSTAFHICANPEFLKEGAAVEDFMKPDRVIVGVDSAEAADVMSQLYAPFVRTGNPIIFMDLPSAEMTKYAANAMLATRISFMNQIALLCDAVGADVTLVRKGIGTDRRIGPAFLFPGPGYGGSCFPKDVKALIHTAETRSVSFHILQAVEAANERQKRVLFEKLARRLGEGLRGATVAVWGLAFKAETDDVRESPALVLVEQLLAAGARVRVHDPAALASARRHLGDRVTYATSVYDAVDGAAALAIVTEWLEYRNPDFERIKRALTRPVIVDGRHLYDPQRMARFLLASTSEVYGDPLVHPQPESYWGNVNPVGPRGVYDEAKRFAEAITMAYHRFHGLDTRIVRIFNTYGPRMRPHDGRVVSNFVVQALKGEPLTVYGDGSQTRSFCYVDDLVEGIVRLFERGGH